MTNLERITIPCKAWRIAAGLSQEEVGFRTGYSQRTISDFERGRNDSATLLAYYRDELQPIAEELSHG